mmetsp:Transcript_36125/g.116011  ORF Transcript_36125/g.116011 Transcript_36125/m.116011 type:complete len:252 (+) Transcript_36125:1364-2119(+)
MTAAHNVGASERACRAKPSTPAWAGLPVPAERAPKPPHVINHTGSIGRVECVRITWKAANRAARESHRCIPPPRPCASDTEPAEEERDSIPAAQKCSARPEAESISEPKLVAFSSPRVSLLACHEVMYKCDCRTAVGRAAAALNERVSKPNSRTPPPPRRPSQIIATPAAPAPSRSAIGQMRPYTLCNAASATENGRRISAAEPVASNAVSCRAPSRSAGWTRVPSRRVRRCNCPTAPGTPRPAQAIASMR